MAGNYKAILSINSKDSSYKFEEYNFYFDNLEGVKKPILLSGKVNSNDYDLLRKTIANSRITKMKDDYGFSGDDNVTGKILYNLSYISGRTEKFIILRGVNPKELTPEFMNLLKLCNKTITDLKR
ncbi:MAG TPA: hypothetical protein VHO90_09215 [Bacteroidales bacterium]|nr:hypothetical protein [Bacteroidales bacterium]